MTRQLDSFHHHDPGSSAYLYLWLQGLIVPDSGPRQMQVSGPTTGPLFDCTRPEIQDAKLAGTSSTTGEQHWANPKIDHKAQSSACSRDTNAMCLGELEATDSGARGGLAKPDGENPFGTSANDPA